MTAEPSGLRFAPDFRDLLVELADAGVEFVIVGATPSRGTGTSARRSTSTSS